MTTYSPQPHARRTHVNVWLVAAIALARRLDPGRCGVPEDGKHLPLE